MIVIIYFNVLNSADTSCNMIILISLPTDLRSSAADFNSFSRQLKTFYSHDFIINYIVVCRSAATSEIVQRSWTRVFHGSSAIKLAPFTVTLLVLLYY